MQDLDARIAPKMPVRFFAGYILFITPACYILWLKPIFTMMFNDGTQAFLTGTNMLTSPMHVLDLGFALPLCTFVAVWLLKRKPWGYFISGVMLSLLAIETFSITANQYFGYLNDPSLSLYAVPLFLELTLIGLAVAIAYFRHAHVEPTQ